MKSLIRIGFLIVVAMPKVAQGQVSNVTLSIKIEGIGINVGAVEDSQKVVAWKYLRATKGIKSRKELKDRSIQILKEVRKLPYERVEVDGVSTTDDTSSKLPGMFDLQLKMSYQNEPAPSGAIIQEVTSFFRWLKDLKSAASDLNRKPTAHAEEVLSAIHDHHVNEIVAHSWGTEAVYAAILSGYIDPPKKLILVGIPEKNYAQWLFLAKYTGIEVHVLGFWTDKVQYSGDLMNHVTGLPRDEEKLEQLWQHRCAQRHDCADPNKFDARKFDYNVDVPEPHGDAIWPSSRPHDLPQDGQASLDHDRTWYYQYLAKRGLLNKTIAQLDQFDVSQQKLIKDQENDTLSEAMMAADSLIDTARREFAKKIAAEEARRQEEAASERRIRFALRGIAVRACNDSSSVSQPELDALPNHVAPGFDERAIDSSEFELSGCAEMVYRDLTFDVDRGKKLDIETFRDEVLRAQPPQPATVIRLAVAAPAAAAPDKLEALRDLAASACDAGPSLSSQGLGAAMWYSVWGFRGSRTAARLARTSEELSGCEKWIFDRTVAMLQAGSPAFDNTDALVYQINRFIKEQPSSYSSGQSSFARAGGGANTQTPSSDSQAFNDNWNRRMKEISESTKESMDRLQREAQEDFERRKREQENAQNFKGQGTGSPLLGQKQ